MKTRMLNTRCAQSEKDVMAAPQEWRQDRSWFAEADFDHMHKTLREESGRTSTTILVKIMLSEGRNSLQRHLRKYLAKAATYDDREGKLLAELYWREGLESSAKGFNQL